MRWVTFEHKGETRPGFMDGDQVVDLGPGKLVDWLIDEAAALSVGRGRPRFDMSEVRLRQPILRPGKILGIGLNYAAHIKESVSFIKNDAPQVQKWFNKQATAANGPYDSVDLPSVSQQLDYEAELVVIIGKHGRHVPEERAMEIVAGFSVGCDYSVRDWQKASPTMIMGKGFDTHAPFGPWCMTPDELGPIAGLGVRSFVNGEQRQSGHAGDMIFSISQQIAHLTAAFTLEPGDVIFTGTPAGVGAGHTPPKWVKAGDTVRVEIDGIGHIQNRIVAETPVVRIGE